MLFGLINGTGNPRFGLVGKILGHAGLNKVHQIGRVGKLLAGIEKFQSKLYIFWNRFNSIPQNDHGNFVVVGIVVGIILCLVTAVIFDTALARPENLSSSLECLCIMQLQYKILNPELLARVAIQPQCSLKQHPSALDAPVWPKKFVRGRLDPDPSLPGENLQCLGVDCAESRPALCRLAKFRVLQVQRQVAPKLANNSHKEQMNVLNDMDVANGILLVLIVFCVFVQSFFSLGSSVVSFLLFGAKSTEFFQHHFRFDVPNKVSLAGGPSSQQIFGFPPAGDNRPNLVFRKNVTVHQIPQGSDHMVEGGLDVFGHSN